ncbi:hypothetical protein XENOCAPTIV_020197 [Xenoophorus captivus]|uniref:Uncharacterized protein n=1 Tax=Xenoophorus captivus TaxID=1517983 RepID=A0ABV0RZX7_9TELE
MDTESCACPKPVSVQSQWETKSNSQILEKKTHFDTKTPTQFTLIYMLLMTTQVKRRLTYKQKHRVFNRKPTALQGIFQWRMKTLLIYHHADIFTECRLNMHRHHLVLELKLCRKQQTKGAVINA